MADQFQLDPGDLDNQKKNLAPRPRRAVRAAGDKPAAELALEEVHLSDYVKIIYRRRWPAGTVFMLVVLAVLVYTFTATPIYKARVQLLIEDEKSNVVSFKEVIEQDKATNDYYQTQYRILQSRSLARRTLDRMGAWDTFDSAKAPKKMSIRTAVASAVAPVYHLFVAKKAIEPEQTEETTTQSRILNDFLSNLTISPIRNSRLVEIEFASPYPYVAANVANSLSKAYIELNLEYKFTASRDASDWLGERMGEQRKTVDASERALQVYREQNDAVSLEERQNIVVQKLSDLNGAVTRAKTERIQKESAYAQIKAVKNDREALDTIPAILSNHFIQQQKTDLAELQQQESQLSEKLGQRHPDMLKAKLNVQNAEARIQAEINKVVQSLSNDYQAALSQEQSLMP
jgi:polysaccharide biosynthesis transport protein